jgi:hypothetical protein
VKKPKIQLPQIGQPFAETVVLYSTPTHSERAEQTGKVQKLDTVQEIEATMRFLKSKDHP